MNTKFKSTLELSSIEYWYRLLNVNNIEKWSRFFSFILIWITFTVLYQYYYHKTSIVINVLLSIILVFSFSIVDPWFAYLVSYVPFTSLPPLHHLDGRTGANRKNAHAIRNRFWGMGGKLQTEERKVWANPSRRQLWAVHSAPSAFSKANACNLHYLQQQLQSEV